VEKIIWRKFGKNEVFLRKLWVTFQDIEATKRKNCGEKATVLCGWKL
jgi:hypothetical protein